MKYVLLILFVLFGYGRQAVKSVGGQDNKVRQVVSIDMGDSRSFRLYAVFPIAAGLAIAGGASALASMFNGVLGGRSASKNLKAQREANATNLQISRETNANNLSLAREQNAWNLAQWQRENAYNDPAAQMGRFARAGINPYMAMNQLTNGNAQSGLTSAQLANQQVGLPVQAVTGEDPLSKGLSTGLSGAVDTFIQVMNAYQQFEKNDLEIQQGKTFNEYYPDLIRSERDSKHLDISRKHYENAGLYYDNIIKRNEAAYQDDPATMQARKEIRNISVNQYQELLKKASADVTLTNNQAAYYKALTAGTNLETSYKGKVLSTQISMWLAQIDYWNKMGNVAQQNADTASYDAKTRRMDHYTNQQNADTNRMDAKTRKLLADHNIKVMDSQVELNNSMRHKLAVDMVETQARISGQHYDNLMKDMMVRRTEANLPKSIQVDEAELAARLNKAKVRGNYEATVTEYIMDNLVKYGQFQKNTVGSVSDFMPKFSVPLPMP